MKSVQRLNDQYRVDTLKPTCIVFNDSFQLGKEIFAPFDSIFEDFKKSRYKSDILIQKIGQNSQLIRFYEDEPGTFTLMRYSNDAFYKTNLENFNWVDVDLPKNSYAYYCNDGTSDLSTNIYVVKVHGQPLFKLWFENGDYDDLSKPEIEKLSSIIDLFSRIKNQSLLLK